MSKKQIYIIVGVSLFFGIIIVIVGLSTLLRATTNIGNRILTPTPIPGPAAERTNHSVPETNPAYLQKIAQEPFWEKLPYWGEAYKIEYKDSDDKILITTLNGTTTQITSYRNDALTWLRQNGARLESLTIEYQTAK